MLSWENTGFNVYCGDAKYPEDQEIHTVVLVVNKAGIFVAIKENSIFYHTGGTKKIGTYKLIADII